MSKQLKESLTVSPFFLLFLIHSTQTGVGFLNFQNKIIKGAEQDAWISVLVVGISVHIIIWLMYYLLKKSNNGDIMSLHQQLFGKWIGNVLNILLYVYMLFLIATIIRSYIAVLNTWVFPYVPISLLSFIILFVITYLVIGGFRVITGICFWGVIIPSILLFTLYFPFKYTYWTNLLPVFNHSISDYYESAKNCILMYSGPEFLLIYFPFIKNNQNSQKWAHISQAYTTILYLFITFVSFAYFSQGQLKHITWPTLMMSKIIRYPFIERFEYVYIFLWLLVILPPCCMAMWGAFRILKESFKFKSRKSLWISIIIVHLIVISTKTRLDVEKIGTFMKYVTSSILYIYIPILFMFFLVFQAFKKADTLRSN
ncbi:GerAB/ArcD/ProY family transporter [Bacillus sp. AFS041924]|uniref:GerAB/ArcD/ProY family transporter n=1 Tax=Bacillus sp. AFS041924 TaxID=2033503 RepID=UPI000BFCD6DC|nr:GerAB/ArcD/ProY family transporter [Bacillus sp. AFS041924]PGS46436.1 spore gernimation protein GerB [Bacillus sp. AFS041924]